MMYEGHTAPQIAGQVIMSGFFIFQLIKNMFFKWQFNMDRTTEQGVPFPMACLLFGFLIQFIGSFLVLFDVYTRIGVVLMIVITVLASGMFHRYWEMQQPHREYHFLLLGYNVFCIGGLLMVI